MKDKVIATDLDGTLLYPKKTVRVLSRKTNKFCKRFVSDGGDLLFVSGRTPFAAQNIAEKLDMKPNMVGCNGAFVMSEGKVVFEKFLDNHLMRECLNLVHEISDPAFILLFTPDYGMVIPRKKSKKFPRFMFVVYNFWQFNLKEKSIVSDSKFEDVLDNGKVYKLMLMYGVSKKAEEVARVTNKKLRESGLDVEFSWSGPTIEITPKGCTKSAGINFYLDYKGYKKDNVIVVGDSGNDITMFDEFPENSFCIAKAHASVKKHAAHIIKRFYNLEEYVYPSAETNKAEKMKEGKKE